MKRQYLLGLAVCLALSVGLTTAAMAGEPSSQAGLPPELTIPAQPALTAQLQTLQALLGAGAGNKATGFLDSLKGAFGGGKAAPMGPAEFVAGATALTGRMVMVCGVFEQKVKGHGVFVYEGGRCPVTLPDSVQMDPALGGKLNGMPVAITGMAEVEGLVGQLRATEVAPCGWLVLMRIGRIQERLGQYTEAVATYAKAGQQAMTTRSKFAAFAKVRAAEITYDELREAKRAKALYSAAWNPFTPKDRRGEPTYYTWVPRQDGSGWDKLGVTEAISEPLDALARTGIWYRVMAFFVELGGGIEWLGVLMMAILSRVVIWPLTKKQLSSAEAMKRLQPQIKALQDRFADDKQKFQEEFWKLCQSNGVNPLGGCLPMIIQIPILIVLWQGIRDYIVQFSGHSFLWVRDLAAPDSALLIAYTVSMVAFQKMTQKLQPNPTMTEQQAQQQKMMTYMMPLMFFWLFKGFPAAFLLYWLATNLVYFVQQYAYSKSQARQLAADGTTSLVEGGAAVEMVTTRGKGPGTGGAKGDSGKDGGKSDSFHARESQAKGRKTGKTDDKPGKKTR